MIAVARHFDRAAEAKLGRLERATSALNARTFDVVVIGGGIHGAWAALDAAQRGMSVALLEKADFGSGASGNSQKIIHGGLRYLQHGHIGRCHRSAKERATLMRLAPHLVQPLPVLVPLKRGRWPGRAAMQAAILAYDLIAGMAHNGRNRLPRGRLLSASELAASAPELSRGGFSGAALFHDAQALNPERLLMAVLWAAAANGASLANRVQVTGFLHSPTHRRILGVKAADGVTGEAISVRGRTIINCTGCWTGNVLETLGLDGAGSRFPTFEATVLVTRQLVRDYALAVAGEGEQCDRDELVRKGYRNYFITPWRGVSLVGTFHPRGGRDIGDFVREFNAASPLKLSLADVYHVHTGRLPAEPGRGGALIAAKRDRIVDHGRSDGLPGVISVVGVKWTTARHAAELAIDLAMKRLGRRHTPARTAEEPIDGTICDPDPYCERAMQRRPDIDRAVLRHLISTYGSAWQRIVGYARSHDELRPVAEGTTVTPAEIRCAVLTEMAQELDDVVLRRTTLACEGHPGRKAIDTCAAIVADELGWDEAYTRAEVDAMEARFEGLGRRGTTMNRTTDSVPRRSNDAATSSPSGERRPHSLMIAPTPFFADRGCHVRILEEARHLRKHGWDVTICTYHHGRDVEGAAIRRSVRVPWYTKLSAGPSPHKFYVDALLLMTVLRECARRRPDVIHAHLHEGALIGALAGAIMGVPVIADMQGSLAGELLQHGFMRENGWVHRLFAGVERFINRLPGAIVASSPRALPELSDRKASVVMVPDGVDAEFFQPRDGTDLRRTLDIPPTARVFGFLGQLNEYQGVPVLLEAAAKVAETAPEAMWLLMGYPDEDRWRDRARQLGVGDRCMFTGRVDYEQTCGMLSCCDFTVSPKLAVSEGNVKLFYYMAMGLPVVASDTQVNREILGDDGVYAAPGNAAELADAMLSLLRDAERAQAIGQRLRDRVLQQFSWDAAAERLIQVYRSVTHRGVDSRTAPSLARSTP